MPELPETTLPLEIKAPGPCWCQYLG